MGSTATANQNEKVSPTWEELLGSKNWEGLIEPPMNLSLRQLILRCGDFCQATGDAFNKNPLSKSLGNSRYSEKSFFDKVMLESASNYQVCSFLYATTAGNPEAKAFFTQTKSLVPWDRETNWFGYIAVTTDEASKARGRREIYVVWRGTEVHSELLADLHGKLVPADSLLSPSQLLLGKRKRQDQEQVPHVMEGWLVIYTSNDPGSQYSALSARSQLSYKIKELIEQYKDEKLSIIVTGHSLGASLSTLAAFDLAGNVVSDIPIAAFVFSSPRVGDKAFKERLDQFPNLKLLHVKNRLDLVPKYPPNLPQWPKKPYYVDTGIELEVDTGKSPYLKPTNILNMSENHNLQGLLHTVDGWQGASAEFKPVVNRSLALVNKSSNLLKDDCMIPESWWIEKNKGMALDKNGEWILDPPEVDEYGGVVIDE